MTKKTVQIAIFKNMSPGGMNGYETVGRVDLYEGEGAVLNEYVRITEIVDVTFDPLRNDAVIQGALRALDGAELEARKELQRKLNDIQNQRAQLLALTHKPARTPNDCPKCGSGTCYCEIAHNE